MPSLFRLLMVVGLLGGAAYGGDVRAREFRTAEAARDHHHDRSTLPSLVKSARTEPHGRATVDDPAPTGSRKQMGAARRDSHEANRRPLIDLFLDMLAAERGAAANTLDAYRRDLDDFSAICDEHGERSRTPTATISAAISAGLSERGFAAASVARRLSAIRQLYRFLYAEGIAATIRPP